MAKNSLNNSNVAIFQWKLIFNYFKNRPLIPILLLFFWFHSSFFNFNSYFFLDFFFRSPVHSYSDDDMTHSSLFRCKTILIFHNFFEWFPFVLFVDRQIHASWLSLPLFLASSFSLRISILFSLAMNLPFFFLEEFRFYSKPLCMRRPLDNLCTKANFFYSANFVFVCVHRLPITSSHKMLTRNDGRRFQYTFFSSKCIQTRLIKKEVAPPFIWINELKILRSRYGS